jgi:hypothetical protein
MKCLTNDCSNQAHSNRVFKGFCVTCHEVRAIHGAVTMKTFDMFHIDIHAWHYFGILRFLDKPGVFLALGLEDR